MRILRGALVALAAIAMLTTVGVASAQTRCGGLLQPKCPPPPPPPPPPAGPIAATLTLEPATIARRVDTKKHVVFRGTIGGVPNPKGITIVLHQTVPGYGLGGTLSDRGTQVAEDGTFRFEIVPTIGVEVQAVVRDGEPATGASPLRRLVMRSMQTLHLRAVSASRGRFVLTTTGPGSLSLSQASRMPKSGPGRIGYLYLIAKNGRTALRIGSGRVRSGGCPDLCKRSAIGYFHISRSIARDGRHFLACARGPMFLAVEDAAVSPQCGKLSITLRRPT
jgi:hypothetical protein